MFTYYDQTTTDALLSVTSVPSQGFTGSQLENIGKLANWGSETQVNFAAVQGVDWGLDLGLGFTTNDSEVLDLGGNPPFNDLNGRIIEGFPVPMEWDRRVANRDEIADFVYIDNPETAANPSNGENVIVGRAMPTTYITPSLTLRTPGNITLSARGEYRGGNMVELNPISISRSVRSPLCMPYYVDPTSSIALRADAPAIWRERCAPSNGDDYWFDGDYFKLRTVSASVPVDFAFPDRVSNAVLTMTLNNAYDWFTEIPWYDPEILSNGAATDDGIGNPTERVPSPATFRISLRVTF